MKMLDNINNIYINFTQEVSCIRDLIIRTFDDSSKKLKELKTKNDFAKSIIDAIMDNALKEQNGKISQRKSKQLLDKRISQLSKKYKISLKDLTDEIRCGVCSKRKLSTGYKRMSLSDKIRFYEKCQTLSLKNGLIDLITSFEEFLRDNFELFYNTYPKTLNKQNVSFSDLSSLNDLSNDSIVDIFAQKRADEILQKNISDVMTDLSKIIKIKSDYYNNYKALIIEMFARRNILIHNKGFVNSFYLNAVISNPFKFKYNDEAKVTHKYLYDACSILLLVASEITLQLIIKFDTTRKKKLYDDMYNAAETVAFNSYLSRRDWKYALEFYKILSSNKHLAQHTKDMYTLNKCLCEKQLGLRHWESDLNSKKKWTSKRPFLQVGYYSLIEDYKKMVSIILKNKNNEKESITPEALKEWPIFIDFRKDNKTLYESTLRKLELRPVDFL